MKFFRISLILLAFVFARCTEETTDFQPQQEQSKELISRSEIDNLIINSLKQNDEFNWSDASDNVIWSALIQSDSILTIGYKPDNEGDIGARMATIDISTKEWTHARDVVLKETAGAVSRSSSQRISQRDLDVRVHETLPFVEIKLHHFDAVQKLRAMPQVRYAEPLGYEVDFSTVSRGSREASNSGCSNDPNNGIPTTDYTTVSPNAKASWNYTPMKITDAWSYSTGSGITVGLIDTGVSPTQTKLNGEFNSGYSSGRYINKYGFYVSSWWWWADPDGPDDQCGHGTAMAGVISAPRSNTGSSVGVAYNANLVAVRGTGDVVVNGGKEKTGVADALVFLGNRSDVKIISMSIGDVFSNSKVADAVRYAYGKDKLIFSAAGTSTSWTNWFGVIFPATMNETVAVTGIKETGYQRCDVCHSGSKVDFTVVMERSGSNNHPLSLAMNGSQPSTVGGSSVATATAAGIAALVWAKNPGMTRDQVLTKLRNTADLYPNRSSDYGWGTLDAVAAVNY